MDGLRILFGLHWMLLDELGLRATKYIRSIGKMRVSCMGFGNLFTVSPV